MSPLRWQPIATLVLSLFGLGVSIYLTITHFDPHSLTCPAPVGGQVFDCAKVTTSPQSEIVGIPVAMLGLVYFVPMVALCLPATWRTSDRRIHMVRLALSIIGIGMILYLITAELFLVKAICLWCTSVHITTFVLFVIIVTATPVVLSREGERDVETWGDGRSDHG
jgi:uncharacterized membrane protein